MNGIAKLCKIIRLEHKVCHKYPIKQYHANQGPICISLKARQGSHELCRRCGAVPEYVENEDGVTVLALL